MTTPEIISKAPKIPMGVIGSERKIAPVSRVTNGVT